MESLGMKRQKASPIVPVAAAQRAPATAPAATKAVTPMEDTMVTEQSRKRRLQESQQRGGVASTVLGTNDMLGG